MKDPSIGKDGAEETSIAFGSPARPVSLYHVRLVVENLYNGTRNVPLILVRALLILDLNGVTYS